MEKEADNKTPFLDVLVERKDTANTPTFLFQKKTHVGHYFNFECHHYPRVGEAL